MKFFTLGPLFFISFISVFTFTIKLDHLSSVMSAFPRSTLMGAIIVEELQFTPRFHLIKARAAITHYFSSNLDSYISYELELTFINTDTNLVVSDNSANRVTISLSSDLMVDKQYIRTLTITLEEQYA